MSINDRLRRWTEEVMRRADTRTETVSAVYDEDLYRILTKLGLLDPLQAGDLRCAISGVPLSWENLGGIIGSPDGPMLISDEAIKKSEGQLLLNV